MGQKKGEGMMPFAGFKDFDVCVLAMREKGHNDESARAICGKMQKDAEMAERSLTLGLLSRFAEFLFFDPSQPRDDQGEWTDTGAGARGGVLGSKKSEGATSKRDTGDRKSVV